MLKRNGRMKNYLVCTVALLALLAGCAPKIWHRHGATQDDYKRVKLACEKEANQAGYDIISSTYV